MSLLKKVVTVDKDDWKPFQVIDRLKQSIYFKTNGAAVI